MGCLTLFESTLPKKPYCCDDYFRGISPRTKSIAVKKLHIQANGPTHLRWLVFDIDHQDSGMLWDQTNMAAPNISVMNPENGHCHYFYNLETPVRTALEANIKPIRYAASIQTAMRKKLMADAGFSGTISKNPLNPHWKTKVWRDEPYSLDELSDYVKLEKPVTKKEQLDNYGLGRNCNLFEDLRNWSYKEIRMNYPNYAGFYESCFSYALNLNLELASPLNINEIKNISKSVSKWTYTHFDNEIFSDIQSARGSLKGKAKRDMGIQMLTNGCTSMEIIATLNVTDRTIRNWKK